MLFLLVGLSLSSITFNESSKIFHLDTAKSSYQIIIGTLNYLVHLYYGKRVDDDLTQMNYLFSRNLDTFPYEIGYIGVQFSLDSALQEYPSFGTGDFRIPAFSAYNWNGTSSVILKYKTHTIQRNVKKPSIPGLPHATSDSNIDILDIELEDTFNQLSVHLFYAVFEEKDIITRWTSITNNNEVGSSKDITITRAMSACLDFHESKFDLLTLSGAYNSERYIDRKPLSRGRVTFDSVRGASSHQQNPVIMLSDKNADEKTGNVISASLVYSGNFAIEVEVDQSDQTRLNIGINPNQFRYIIHPNETFYTPEVILAFSDQGFGEISRKMHRFVRENIMQSEWKNKRKPILINSWEAAYFNFDDDKLIDMAKDASKLGIELFVLDDGWFGHRDNDNSSLGDWYVNRNKIKKGMGNLAKEINNLGMMFGLWFEPEMINEDSDLFRAHPEFAMRIPGRNPQLGRNQLVLDFTNPDVVDNIYKQMTDILDNANISYVKWDMNRQITDLFSFTLPPEQQGEIFHRYILNLYDLLDRLLNRYPHLLIEGCSSGGGRFDLGLLYYSPQYWTSDDTDPIERIKIQYGTSMIYPASSMGAHVSVSPNHQTGRSTPFETRAIVAMSGTFGYELDTRNLAEEDRNKVIEQNSYYNKYYDLVQFGDLYRLLSPFESHYFCAWMFVNEDKSRALLNVFKILTRVDITFIVLKLDGLNPSKIYTINGMYDGQCFSGASLMNAGIIISTSRDDYNSNQYEIVEVKNNKY
ncbi:hypothetical protein M9Y10_001908 [Tritrichomonas musculus]|uniref:alpha-galactosidase n=1 Tax=Tritrichomonas musculus TaxID=1915356 RepID=A0ABR2L8N9_9EUKA